MQAFYNYTFFQGKSVNNFILKRFDYMRNCNSTGIEMPQDGKIQERGAAHVRSWRKETAVISYCSKIPFHMLNINNCLCVFYLLLKCTEKHICPPLVDSPDIHNNLTAQAAARSLEFILDLPCGWQGSKLLEQSASQCSWCQEAVTGRRAGTSRRAVQYGNADITCSLLNNPFIFISSKFIVKLYQLEVFFSLPWNLIQYIIPN